MNRQDAFTLRQKVISGLDKARPYVFNRGQEIISQAIYECDDKYMSLTIEPTEWGKFGGYQIRIYIKYGEHQFLFPVTTNYLEALMQLNQAYKVLNIKE